MYTTEEKILPYKMVVFYFMLKIEYVDFIAKEIVLKGSAAIIE